MNSACTVRLRTVFHRPHLKFAQSAKFSRRVLCEDGELSVFVSALLRPSSVLTPSSPSFYRPFPFCHRPQTSLSVLTPSFYRPHRLCSVLSPTSPFTLRLLSVLYRSTPCLLRPLPCLLVHSETILWYISVVKYLLHIYVYYYQNYIFILTTQ